MTLREWRRRNRRTLKDCAELFGAQTWNLVWRWENGKQLPRVPQMRRIYAATAGQVDPNSFYDLPELPLEAAA